MFILNHQWLWKDYYRMDQPHYCPKCCKQLEKIKRAEVLPPGSELQERLNRSYHVLDRTSGNVKYHWTEFKCPVCGRWYSIDDVRKMEEER